MPSKHSESKSFDSFTQRPDGNGLAITWSQGIALATGLLSLRKVIPKPIMWTVLGVGAAGAIAMYLKNHKADYAEEMA